MLRKVHFKLIFIILYFFINISASQNLFELSVVHFNDFHARYEQIGSVSGVCYDTPTCVGGFARLTTQIQEILAAKPDSILLNGGDNFQGTLYYSLGKWNITQQFLNKLPFDAIVLGNHEFDNGLDGVVPFITHSKAPVVCTNIDDSLEPSIQGTYTKSTVVERNGKKIGIIGVIYSKTNEISTTGKLKFLPESSTVNEEAERLVREEGVFTNIVLSHVGYDIDKEIAANASEKIGLIVGGHSHTFLYSGDDPQGPDAPEGPYPTIIKSKNNKDVLIVQAFAYTKYLGNITVFYDDNGEVVNYEGSPIYLSNDIPQDENITKELAPWKELVDSQGSVVLGSTHVTLSKTGCYFSECSLGNFVTDAYIFAYVDTVQNEAWTGAAIGITNAGGLRDTIGIGDVTYNDLLLAQPFGNTVDFGQIKGKYIKEVLEQGTKEYNNQRVLSDLKLLHVSGAQVVYNLTRPFGERVQSIKVRCQKCLVPEYEDLDLEETYNVAVNSYVAGGGDGYTAVSENIENLAIGQVDVEVFMKYLQSKSPVFQEVDGRITVYSDEEIRFKSNE
ncbi:apyrase-like [Sitophilus oryzae]|uniref:apyrase n=1 Tax=Sitophilus oryzae TaxID=7048 RepID=A0A6J2Y4M8_SITOR|nr:apyrase-like [Sitophilus oryzae]